MGSICSNPRVATPSSPASLPASSLCLLASPSLYPFPFLQSWLHSDICEGDVLLLTLLQLLPSRKPEITHSLQRSISVRQRDNDWQACQTYIRERYSLCGQLCSELVAKEQTWVAAKDQFLAWITDKAMQLQASSSVITQIQALTTTADDAIFAGLAAIVGGVVGKRLGAEDCLWRLACCLREGRYARQGLCLCWLKWKNEALKGKIKAQKSALGKSLSALKEVHAQIKGEMAENCHSFAGGCRRGVSQGVNTDFGRQFLTFDSWNVANIAGKAGFRPENSTEIVRNHGKTVKKLIKNHVKSWSNSVRQFADPLNTAGIEIAQAKAPLDLETTEKLIFSALESTRKAAFALIGRPQPTLPSWLASPLHPNDELPLFGVSFAKENDPRAGNSHKKAAFQPENQSTSCDPQQFLSEKEAEIARLTFELASKSQQIASLQGEIATLKQAFTPISAPPSPKYTLTVTAADCDSRESIRLKALKSVLMQSSARVVARKRLSFVTWVHRSELGRGDRSYLDEFSPEVSLNSTRVLNFDGEMREIQQDLMAENVLLQVRDRRTRADKGFTQLQLLKFFEEMMSKKYECDQMDLKNNRCPKSIPIFIMEYLTRMFGLRKLAIKTINQLLPTLESCTHQGHQYAVLFSQLAQIFHPAPVPYMLSIFLAKKMVEFEEFSGKKEQFTPTKDAKHYSFTGGEALLSDIIPYVYTLFEADRASGQLLIRLIKPQSVCNNDYVLCHIGLRLSKIAINPDNLFTILEENGRSESAFVAGLRRALDIWVSREELKSALKSIVGGSGVIGKAALSGKVNHKMYQRYVQTGEFEVAKYSFLLGLIEVYQTKEERYFSDIHSACSSFPRSSISFDDFTTIIHRIDPTVPTPRIATIFSSIAGKNFDISINFRTVFRALTRYPIGVMGKSVFCELYSDVKELGEMMGEPQEEVIRSQPASPCPDSAGKGRKNLLMSEGKCRTPVPFLLERYI